MNPLLVISGGSKGIGRAIIEKFAQQGFDIATCSRKEADLIQLKQNIESQYSVEVFTQARDLSKQEDVDGWGSFLLSLGRKVDVLVNNTGFFMPGSVLEEQAGNLEMMLHTNLYSAYYLTRYLAPWMIAQQDGHIFNICSIASIMAYPNGGSYSISKFALYGYTKVLREELKNKGIRVTAVLPGATLTDSWAGVDLPSERFMKASDVAEAVFAAFGLSKQTVIEELLLRPQLGDI